MCLLLHKQVFSMESFYAETKQQIFWKPHLKMYFFLWLKGLGSGGLSHILEFGFSFSRCHCNDLEVIFSYSWNTQEAFFCQIIPGVIFNLLFAQPGLPAQPGKAAVDLTLWSASCYRVTSRPVDLTGPLTVFKNHFGAWSRAWLQQGSGSPTGQLPALSAGSHANHANYAPQLKKSPWDFLIMFFFFLNGLFLPKGAPSAARWGWCQPPAVDGFLLCS